MNLIVTCPRNFETETQHEIGQILGDLGDENAEVVKTSMRGILTVSTRIDPQEVVKGIKEKIIDEPWSIRYCLRVIPIYGTVDSNIPEISKKISEFIDVIQPKDTYRITVEKRNSDISTEKIISDIAKNIPNKVSLENPTWIVLIEILGNKTGIAVIEKNSILSVTKIKRSLSD